MQRLSKGQLTLALLLALAAGAAALLNIGSTSLTCAFDTSNCAHSHTKDGVYEGTLRTLDGEPYRSAQFEVSFASRQDEPEVTFTTDTNGRYCIVWASERMVPFVKSESGQPLSGRDSEPIPGLGRWRDLEGQSPPPGCQEGDAGIPWNRADDADSTWQFWLMTLLPLATLALALAAVLGRNGSRAPLLLQSASALLAADLVAGLALWGII